MASTTSKFFCVPLPDPLAKLLKAGQGYARIVPLVAKSMKKVKDEFDRDWMPLRLGCRLREEFVCWKTENKQRIADLFTNLNASWDKLHNAFACVTNSSERDVIDLARFADFSGAVSHDVDTSDADAEQRQNLKVMATVVSDVLQGKIQPAEGDKRLADVVATIKAGLMDQQTALYAVFDEKEFGGAKRRRVAK